MTPVLSNRAFLLLPLAMLVASVGVLANSQAGSALAPLGNFGVNVTMNIKSEMGAGTNLSVHCKTEPTLDRHRHNLTFIDLGERGLADQELYSVSINIAPDNVTRDLDRTIYYCQFKTMGFPQCEVWVFVGGFYPHPKHSLCKCVDSGCALWEVEPEGFFCGGQKMRTWYK